MIDFIKDMFTSGTGVSSKRVLGYFIIVSSVGIALACFITGRDIPANAFYVLLQLIAFAALLFGLTYFDKKIDKI